MSRAWARAHPTIETKISKQFECPDCDQQFDDPERYKQYVHSQNQFRTRCEGQDLEKLIDGFTMPQAPMQ